jgi:molybdate transport system substrate-binding protein
VRAHRLALAVALALSGCAASESEGAQTDRAASLTVLAAASLDRAFPEIGASFTATNPSLEVRFTFAGTDFLAAQIEQGAQADVFAGASTLYGDRLEGRGLIEPHRSFCTNGLALVVPASNPAGIRSPADLSRAGLKVVVGAESVPIGNYTRTVLDNLDGLFGDRYSADVLANVVSNEEHVEAVLAKVILGEADAGFVYVTDARAAGSDVVAIDLPSEAQATASYPIAVVAATARREDAQRFVDFVLGPEGQALLRLAGFGPPPA